MTDENEAAAGLLIAEFEARREKERVEVRARRWRFAFAVARIGLISGAGVYMQIEPRQIPVGQALGLLAIFIGISAWESHQLHERIRALESEVVRLEDEREKKTA